MSKLGIFIEALLFLALACVLALFGTGIPVHFRTVAPGVLVEAGHGTPTLEQLTDLYLDAGKTGPATLLDATYPRIEELLRERPQYALTGGPSPYLEQFLEIAGIGPEIHSPQDIISLLLPAANRGHMRDFLEYSAHATVKSVLDTRSLTGTVLFMPVSSAAGQPLEATILTTALLLQGSHIDAEMARELRLLAEEAVAGERTALVRLEKTYLSLLSLGKRFNWTQLTELMGSLSSWTEVEQSAAAFRQHEDDLSLIYGLILLSKDAEGVFRYAEKYPEDGWGNLNFALSSDKGAVEELIAQAKPLYHPPAFVQLLDRPISWIPQAPLLSFTHRHPQAAINLKIFVILAAGYALALFLSDTREIFLRQRGLSRLHPVMMLENSFVSLFGAITLWVLMEPTLFESGPEPKAQLRLDFNVANNLQSLKSQNLETVMLDQITILIILMFFLLQLIVYVFCLIKITEIKKQPEEPAFKMKLLENEDNLFDLGLYVGLGGTVSSLILLAMDIVQASLIAAYSSTLFGIIFVALLKIFHVRPFRRGLIVEAEKGNQSHEQGSVTDTG